MDVCRVEVIFGVMTSSPFSSSLYVNDGVENQTHVIVMDSAGNFAITRIPNEYTDWINLEIAPNSLDPITTPFTFTLRLNLPRNFTKALSFRIVSAGQEIQTEQSYSIANNCSKGN